MIREPVMLVGSERSGTTLLRLMLDHHPEIACLAEFEFAVDMVADRGEWPPLPEFRSWLQTHRDFLEYEFHVDPDLTYPELVDGFLEQKRERDGKPLVGATVHRHFDRLLHIWPDARFIHLLRDGRDVAASVVAMGWAGNTWTGVERWVEAERLWESLRDRIAATRRIDVRYEQLVASPVEVLTEICRFLGTSFDERMFDYAATTSYSKPDAKLAYQWKTKQTGRQVQLVEARVSDMLTERGYALSGLSTLEVTGRLERALRFQDRLARSRARIRMYGLRLFLEDVLSRRLGLDSWQEVVKIRLNSIDRELLK